MSALRVHEVQQIKLVGEKFDYLLLCKTCGWKAYGLDGIPPSADDRKKRHQAIHLGMDAGDPDFLFGRVERPTNEQKLKAFEEKARSLEMAQKLPDIQQQASKHAAQEIEQEEKEQGRQKEDRMLTAVEKIASWTNAHPVADGTGRDSQPRRKRSKGPEGGDNRDPAVQLILDSWGLNLKDFCKYMDEHHAERLPKWKAWWPDSWVKAYKNRHHRNLVSQYRDRVKRTIRKSTDKNL
jgi:hypothetical protein